MLLTLLLGLHCCVVISTAPGRLLFEPIAELRATVRPSVAKRVSAATIRADQPI